jgi:hypothetical protein
MLVALLLAVGAGLWGWQLATESFAASPRLAAPGTIAIATSTSSPVASGPIDVVVSYDAAPGQATTGLVMSLTHSVAEVATKPPPTVLVLLCGPIADDPHFTDNRGRRLAWARPILDHGDIQSSLFGRASDCVYTTLTLSASGFSQALLIGSSGGSISAVSGGRILYALPGVVALRSRFPIGNLNPEPLPAGSTLDVNLEDVPGDLADVVASPQLPDAGRLRWTATFGTTDYTPTQYRLGGDLGDRQTAEQRQLFIAGALVGIAGGGLVWFLELGVTALVGRRESDGSNHEPAD